MSYCNGIVTRRQQSDYARKLLKKQGFVPRVIVTDKLKSYEAAKKQVLKNVEHRQHKGLNNRAENSHDSDTSSRATNAAIQIARSSPALSFRVGTDARPLPPETTSTDCPTLPTATSPTLSRLARSRLSEICCLGRVSLTLQGLLCLIPNTIS